ncbi:endonuclease/exonuclease/phosphatase family protein [Nisaea nitritireducens]|uniref:endonuclease/exonuclease/phosphatase family protein n=1 Tax=Nisaea nitritireducens TaxID=568392 RepID=UPI001866209A|nr:endonuclease/exonuclease/phosphatase family protein [Nisaea nitritireducens]
MLSHPFVRFVVIAAVGAASYIASPALAEDCYNVASWNLEHFGFGKSRGFPENTDGGPSYEARTPAQRNAIADAIQNKIQARLLILNEINGVRNKRTSKELDELTKRLGTEWKYFIGLKGGRGGSQRVALLWNTRYVKPLALKEIYIKESKVGGADIFNRDPLAGRFVFLKNGNRMNDLVVVGLHLASGQRKTKNHDAAMKRLRGELRALRGRDRLLPKDEDDIILAGDLNANAFDQYRERFFKDFNRGNWRVLAKKGAYSATRLAGVPLNYGSPIDYIIATTKSGHGNGLVGEELPYKQAKVWRSLIPDGNFDKFRRIYSDHLPVSVCVRVVADND